MKLKTLAATLALTLTAASSWADPQPDLAKLLKEKYPATTFTSVAAAPVNGLYEVAMGKNIAYTDAAGRYFIFGHVYDMTTQEDLTAARLQSLSKIDWSRLNPANAIKVVKGDGSREFAVFSDPDCPYCQKLDKELALLDNYTMYLFMFPIAGLHPSAPDKARSIWCAKDRHAAWTDTTLAGKSPAKKDCANPVDANIALAAEMGIQGTPTMIRKDGAMMPGAAPAAKINSWLSAGK